MQENQNNTEMVYYYMIGNTKVWTPNPDLAYARATYHESDGVFFEKFVVKDIDTTKN